jgi:prolipoprotein diacylglyceryltransferase
MILFFIFWFLCGLLGARIAYKHYEEEYKEFPELIKYFIFDWCVYGVLFFSGFVGLIIAYATYGKD